MANYCVNKNAQSNGDHEVHREGCIYWPLAANRIDVGDYATCDTVHIPRDPGHLFHAMPDSIPRDRGHRYTRCRTPFQMMPDIFGSPRGIG